MPPSTSPTPPAKTGGPDRSWPHRRLYENVIKTLYALPEEFRTSLAFAYRHGLTEQIEPRVLKPLGLPALHECNHLQLKAIEQTLQIVTLYP